MGLLLPFFKRAALRRCAALLVAFAMLACSDGSAPVEPGVRSVAVTPEQADVPIGETLTLVATVQVVGGASQEVLWSSSDESIATVSASGVVTSHALGPVSVTATSTFDDARQATASLQVFQPDNEPATVEIQSITQSGTSNPVNRAATSGSVDVLLDISPGDRFVSLVELTLDGTVMASRSFGQPGALAPTAREDDVLGAGEPFTVSLTVNTAAFTALSGVPLFLNGTHTMEAQLTTLGGVTGGSASTQLVFVNQNTLAAIVNASGTSATDLGGREWKSGDLTVTAVPVNYSPSSVTLSSAVIGFPGLQNKTAGPGGVVTWPRNVAIASGGSNAFSNNGGLSALAPIPVSSTLSNGLPGPSGAFANAADVTLRLDNRAPDPGVVALTTQSITSPCCSGGWIGNSYLFASGHSPPPGDGDGVDGAGIGGSGVTYHVGTPGLSNDVISLTPPITSGAQLAESGFANAYTVVARVSDRVGNVSLVRLSPSDGNPSSVFGVDKGAPLFGFNNAISLASGAVNPAVLLFATTPVDAVSGFSATPVLHRITRNFSASLCILGGPDCTPVQGSTVISGSTQEGFYFTYEASVRDQAGNSSPVITRTVLVDHQVPEVTVMPVPGLLVGGASIQFDATVSDNLDLHSAQHRLDFPQFNSALTALPFRPPVPLGAFGLPLLQESGVFQSTVFVRAMELTNAEGAPSGVMLPAQGTRYRVLDQAANSTNRTAAFPPGSVPAGSSATSRALQIFRLAAPAVPVTLCSGPPCGVAPQSITLTAEASGPAGTFQNPFGAGVFFYWVDGAGVTQLISSSTAAGVEEVGPTRRWTWSVTFSAPGASPQIGVQVFAIGVSSNGDGLRTPVNTNVIIVGGSE